MGNSKLRVVVLGAGFGGLEVAAVLSEKLMQIRSDPSDSIECSV